MNSKESIAFIDRALRIEEDAVKSLSKHLEAATDWVGLTNEENKKIKDTLSLLRKESEEHKTILETLKNKIIERGYYMITNEDFLSYLSELEIVEKNMRDIYELTIETLQDDELKKTFLFLRRAEDKPEMLVAELRKIIIKKMLKDETSL